jgi:hypothetical protein
MLEILSEAATIVLPATVPARNSWEVDRPVVYGRHIIMALGCGCID